MENAADSKPVVALLCTRGMETFLANSLHSILAVGIDPDQVHIGCPGNALAAVTQIAKAHSENIHVFSGPYLSRNESDMENYSEFDSQSFKDICWKKVALIRDLLQTHHHVVYADLDIAWLRNPLPYLATVALHYPMAFQTEALPRFPPTLCCGFASFLKSETTIEFLEQLIAFDAAQPAESRLNDQEACNALIKRNVAWLQDIYCLPESLFLNGLSYRNLLRENQAPVPMGGELAPFLFHANFAVGTANKQRLFSHTGTWFVEDRRSWLERNFRWHGHYRWIASQIPTLRKYGLAARVRHLRARLQR